MLLDVLARGRREGLEVRFPEVKAARATFERHLKELGLERLERFRGNDRLLVTVLRNRLSPRGDDPLPVAVVVGGRVDRNGALEAEDFEPLTAKYRLMYYEASKRDEFGAAVRDATQARPAELLFVAGHGNGELTAFGERDPAFNEVRDFEAVLTTGDGRWLREAGVAAAIAPGGHVVLRSCLAGKGQHARENIANTFATAIPHATVHAARDSINGQHVLNWDGSFRDPGFSGRNGRLYRVPPRV
jgi:hypothetical protein